MNKLAIAALFTLIALATCTANDDQTPQIAGSERQALEQAKGVEAQIQQQADETRQKIDDASQ